MSMCRTEWVGCFSTTHVPSISSQTSHFSASSIGLKSARSPIISETCNVRQQDHKDNSPRVIHCQICFKLYIAHPFSISVSCISLLLCHIPSGQKTGSSKGHGVKLPSTSIPASLLHGQSEHGLIPPLNHLRGDNSADREIDDRCVWTS